MGKPEGDRGKSRRKREGLDVKFYTFAGGALLFSFPFISWKKGRRAVILSYSGIKNIEYRCSDH